MKSSRTALVALLFVPLITGKPADEISSAPDDGLAGACPRAHHDVGALYLGDLTEYKAGVAGSVFALDDRTLYVKDFEYSGEGPDVFFWAGSTARPSSAGDILPFPNVGKFFGHEDRSAPTLEKRPYEKVNAYLPLPPGMTVADYKWISLWCREYAVNFGDLIFPLLPFADSAEATED